MKTICYIATSFVAENDFRFAHKQCPGLVKKGFKVSYFVQSDEEKLVDGVKIIPIRREKSKLKQALLPWKLMPRLLRQRCQAYHLGNAELLPIALALKAITRRRVVFDSHEDFIEFVQLKPYLKEPLKSVLVGVVRLIVWVACKTLDGIVFGDEGVQENYPKVRKNRWTFFHHFPLLSMFEPSPISFAQRKYDVVYLGCMSETGGIFVMLEAVALLKQRYKNLRALFIGQPVVYIEERFYNFIKERGLEDTIEVTGRMPYPKVPELLNQAKVGLIGLLDLPKFHKQSATKLFEYMAKGIPCVSVDLPPERRFMISGEHGYLVPPEKPQAMADAVYKIISEPKLGQKMAENCREYLLKQGYYAEKEIDKLAEFYDYILTYPRGRLCGS